MNSTFFKNSLVAAAMAGSVSLFGQTSVETPEEALFDNRVNLENMVNPSTGDLNYSKNVLTIPGSEGSFPINLNYTAGVRYNQESTWVGVGWDLASFEIERSVSEIPDDYYSGELLNKRRHSGGEQVYGEDESALGFFVAIAEFLIEVIISAFNPVSLVLSTYDLYKDLNASSGKRHNFSSLSSWDWDFQVQPINAGKTLVRWFIFQNNIQRGYGLLHQYDMPVTPEANTVSNESQILNYFNGNKHDVHDQVSTDTLNVASDYFQFRDSTGIFDNEGPIFWASDQYTLKTPFMGGRLVPHRFDNASVAVPMGRNRFYDEDVAVKKVRLSRGSPAKPVFTLFNEVSNFYDFNKTKFGGDYALEYEAKEFFDPITGQNVKKPFLGANQSFQGVEPNRTGFQNGRLVMGTSIQWWTNEEIQQGDAFNAGFMDYQAYADRVLDNGSFTYNSNPNPSKGIGGMMVTDKNGMTYHFSLPVYVLEEETMFWNIDPDVSYTDVSTFLDMYAAKWLLTGITGPDFVDSGSTPGQIDLEDEGYFVKLEYGKLHDAFVTTTGAVYPPKGLKYRVSEWSVFQEYYLNKISTRTHSALFLKSFRDDHTSITKLGYDILHDGKSLKLDKIVLLENKALDNLTINAGSSYLGNVLLTTDISESELRSETLQSVSFSQSYHLTNRGKMMLNSMQSYGLQEAESLPPYEFEYGLNPAEDALDWDAWGFYKDNLGSGPESHKRESTREASAWSLSEIYMPTGSVVSIEYESDDYRKVRSREEEDTVLGGDLRVAKISFSDPEIDAEIINEYYYTLEGTANGTSSGVATGIPIFQNPEDTVSIHLDEKIFKNTGDMVTYSDVTRIERSNSSVLSKTVWEFHTAENTLSIDTLLDESRLLSSFSNIGANTAYSYRLNQSVYDVTYKEGLIGSPKKISNYDNSNTLLNSTEYQYSESNLGKITQSLNLFDESFAGYIEDKTEENRQKKNIRGRYITTFCSQTPYVISKINLKDYAKNVSTETVYRDFDFYSGQPLTSITTDGYGNKIATVSESAYSESAYSGSNGMQPVLLGGKNLLTQKSGQASYEVQNKNDDLVTSSPVFNGIMGANAQTYGYDNNTWRVNGTFILNKDVVGADGKIALLDQSEEFDHGAASNLAIWENGGKVLTYDEFSHPVELEVSIGQYSAIRYNGDQTRIIAQANNARLSDFVFSSFEVPLTDESYTNGLTVTGARSGNAHAGTSGLSIANGQTGVSFSIPIEARNNNKVYSVKLWVLNSGNPQFELNYTINGTQGQRTINVNSGNYPTVNGWTLIQEDIDVEIASLNASSSFDVGIKNIAAGTLFIDDLKISPIDSDARCYVYDELGNPAWVFGINHFFIHVVYDGFGRKKEVYQETASALIKREEYTYNLGRSSE